MEKKLSVFLCRRWSDRAHGSKKSSIGFRYMVELFERVGLQTNELKTKFMVVWGAAAPRA